MKMLSVPTWPVPLTVAKLEALTPAVSPELEVGVTTMLAVSVGMLRELAMTKPAALGDPEGDGDGLLIVSAGVGDPLDPADGVASVPSPPVLDAAPQPKIRKQAEKI